MVTAKDHVTNSFGHKIVFNANASIKEIHLMLVTKEKVHTDIDFAFLQKDKLCHINKMRYL